MRDGIPSVETAESLVWTNELYCTLQEIIEYEVVMLHLNTSTLRRALDLQVKIESLQKELTGLLGKGAAMVSATIAEVTSAPRRRGRKPGRKAAPKKAVAKKRKSPFRGKKRPASPSGPLAPAVHKVMKRAGGPVNVDAVLQGLKQDKYVWNVTDPKKNLAARIYTMPGVKKVGPGMFALARK
jgi:hypothetical protein